MPQPKNMKLTQPPKQTNFTSTKWGAGRWLALDKPQQALGVANNLVPRLVGAMVSRGPDAPYPAMALNDGRPSARHRFAIANQLVDMLVRTALRWELIESEIALASMRATDQMAVCDGAVRHAVDLQPDASLARLGFHDLTLAHGHELDYTTLWSMLQPVVVKKCLRSQTLTTGIALLFQVAQEAAQILQQTYRRWRQSIKNAITSYPLVEAELLVPRRPGLGPLGSAAAGRVHQHASNLRRFLVTHAPPRPVATPA
ncbi:Aste57867_12126 [Aphanomyces stellatus]|uniref:Aste57867_12126 protein n=1 Tax=Aphanomyces stellatus TaxID=120398 RepID=A0A485KVC4_9STRA|nr:hypothetical protein As57867_012081 [Aphanomyces stellatus]VFT88980.1 Aste57867_12126 [Aphanomyces stellatus]